MRADDEIEIAVHKQGSVEAQIVRRLAVPPDGEVSFSPVGRIELTDKTASEVEDDIARRLTEKEYMKQPIVGCLVTKYAPRTAAVVGALQQSVQLPVHGDVRILEVLSRIGAIGADGVDLAHVEIRRVQPDGAAFRFIVNVNDVYSVKDEKADVVVREGDIINIPRLGGGASPQYVYVLGRVFKPGAIRMPQNGSPFTLVKVIAACGDFTDFAKRSKVRVIHTDERGRKVQEVDFDEIIDGTRPDVELHGEDVVVVPESAF